MCHFPYSIYVTQVYSCDNNACMACVYSCVAFYLTRVYSCVTCHIIHMRHRCIHVKTTHICTWIFMCRVLYVIYDVTYI